MWLMQQLVSIDYVSITEAQINSWTSRMTNSFYLQNKEQIGNVELKFFILCGFSDGFVLNKGNCINISG